MDIHGIVKKIVGEISPIGESNEDEQRYINLHIHVYLTENLIKDLIYSARYKDRAEHSMSKIGRKAHKELVQLKNILDEYIEED